MKHVELFAGCGGMSLGLSAAGYELLFANELSPMAAETFAFNLLDEDLDKLPSNEMPSKTLWLSSQFKQSEFKKRLREFPVDAMNGKYGEVPRNIDEVRGKLLVGSIIQLNKILKKNTSLCKQLVDEDIDLVSGGPPCQSFSLAGLRQHDNHRNTLPAEFAEFVSLIKPKTVLLENVTGILRPFKLKSNENEKYYAWFEVARAFARLSYYPICLHVNAKYVGVPQNRPRFIMFALNEELFNRALDTCKNNSLKKVLSKISSFVTKENASLEVSPGKDKDLDYIDIEKHPKMFQGTFLSPLLTHDGKAKKWISSREAICDLSKRGARGIPLDYLKDLHKSLRSSYKNNRVRVLSNHEKRENSQLVKMRFNLYQHISKSNSPGVDNDIRNYLSGNQDLLSGESIEFLLGKKLLQEDGCKKYLLKESQLYRYLYHLRTKKHSQQALLAHLPAPATLSIPDDICHYDAGEPRTLTVRELARFQSFPDWFEFRSKITTGGQNRRHEVPQYTQVGNAVPPLLGKALGEVVLEVLNLGVNIKKSTETETHARKIDEKLAVA